MLLDPGESVRRSAYAVCEPSGGRPPGLRPGVLYLTNHRLLFEAPVSRGRVRDLIGGRDTRLLVDARLGELRNATVRRGRLRGERLVVELPGGLVGFDVLEPEAWVSAIAQARREGSAPPPAGGAPGAGVERTIVKIRCRYCSALGEYGAGRCPACGAPL